MLQTRSYYLHVYTELLKDKIRKKTVNPQRQMSQKYKEMVKNANDS